MAMNQEPIHLSQKQITGTNPVQNIACLDFREHLHIIALIQAESQHGGAVGLEHADCLMPNTHVRTMMGRVVQP
jgi:hypothetical protein